MDPSREPPNVVVVLGTPARKSFQQLLLISVVTLTRDKLGALRLQRGWEHLCEEGKVPLPSGRAPQHWPGPHTPTAVLRFPQPSKGSPVQGGSGLALVKITGEDKTMGCSALEGHKEETPENLAWAVVKEEEGHVTRSPPLCLLGVSHSGIGFPKVSPPVNSKQGIQAVCPQFCVSQAPDLPRRRVVGRGWRWGWGDRT